MRLSSLFRRSKTALRRDESFARLGQEVHTTTSNRAGASIRSRVEPSGRAKHTTIFDMFGQSGHANTRAEVASRLGKDELLGTLYEQYCEAVVSPQVLSSSQWHMPMTRAQATHRSISIVHESGASGQTHNSTIQDWINPEAVMGLLGDIDLLEEAFGPLQKGGPPEPLRIDGVPEVLLLFAPPELQSQVGNRCASIPPVLAQREHHTLSIDSPLPALSSVSEDARRDAQVTRTTSE